jgi:hypothetical protein
MKHKCAILLITVSLAGVYVLLAVVFPTRTVQLHSCVECRLRKRVTTTWYSEATKCFPNVCSEWYCEKFPDHTHRWVAHGCWSRTSATGTGVICFGPCALDLSDPYTQRSYLENTDRSEWPEFFDMVGSREEEHVDRALTAMREAEDRSVVRSTHPARATDAARE